MFMDYFGINDLNELPTQKDFSADENTIGEKSTRMKIIQIIKPVEIRLNKRQMRICSGVMPIN